MKPWQSAALAITCALAILWTAGAIWAWTKYGAKVSKIAGGVSDVENSKAFSFVESLFG